MNKIKQIRLQNFMSWEEGVFDLHPGVNVILGESDKGKSVLFRAVRWVAGEQWPRSVDYCSDWGGATTATIVFEDGLEITRVRDKNKNQYILSTLEDPLENFGTTIPDEVLTALNMSDINFQDQDNPNFLLNESPPEVGRRLNEIASLSDIDITFQNNGRRIKKLRDEIKINSQQIEQQKEKLQSLAWVDKADEDVKEIENLFNKLTKIQIDERDLRNAKNEIENLQSKIEEYNKILIHEKEFNSLLDLIEESNNIKDTLDELIDIEESLNDAQALINEANKILIYESDINELDKLIFDRDQIQNEYDLLLYLEDEINDALEQKEESIKKQKELEKEYDRIKPKICPLCDQEWPS